MINVSACHPANVDLRPSSHTVYMGSNPTRLVVVTLLYVVAGKVVKDREKDDSKVTHKRMRRLEKCTLELNLV